MSVVSGISDYDAILTTLDIRLQKYSKPQHEYFQYHKGNFDAIRTETEIFTNTFFESEPSKKSIEDNWKSVQEHTISVMNKFIPKN